MDVTGSFPSNIPPTLGAVSFAASVVSPHPSFVDNHRVQNKTCSGLKQTKETQHDEKSMLGLEPNT